MLEEIVNQLEKKIEMSLLITDLHSIFDNLKMINSSTLLCGVGGSHVVSVFLEKILVRKNGAIVKNIDVEEYFQGDFCNYNNLILVSYSGKNWGIKRLARANKKKYLFTTRRSKIYDEVLLNYSIERRIKSFVSLEDTFIPMSILLCYYLDLFEVPFSINLSEKFDVREFKNVNIIYDYNTKTCATFLETTFVEAGIASVTMHTKYSLCHGRSNLLNNKEALDIYLVTVGSELDEVLISELPKISNNFLVLKDNNKDSIIADYSLTIKALSFLNYLSKTYDMDFVKVKYNKIVPMLYNFKGELI